MGDTGKFHLETHDSAVSTELGAVDLEFKHGINQPGDIAQDRSAHIILAE